MNNNWKSNMKNLLVLIAFFASFSLQASIISIETSETNVSVGDTVEISVVGTGLDPFDSLSFDVEFDTSLFSFNSLSQSSDLSDVFPLIFSVSSQSFGVAVSFLDFFEFTNSDFTAIKFEVTALAAGATDFLLVNSLSNIVIDTGVTQIPVTVNEVDAPATLILILFAVLMVFCGRVK